MTDVSYKIIMSLIGREIEKKKHMAGKIEKFEQLLGWIYKRRISYPGYILDNLLILRECVEEIYRKREQMVAIAKHSKSIWFSKKKTNGRGSTGAKDTQ